MSIQPTEWPQGVIARYLTVGGALVDLIEQPGYTHVSQNTETTAKCTGCHDNHTEDWGFDFWANEHGEPQPPSFDRNGEWATRKARTWAQAHAEKCRALPRPGGAA
ncbi:hypothetical protein [Streptomyces glaucus]|uniref:Cytochrome c domain-containing protein n=1 Tax=Streptomyces glaucus TaxID=284029 RepID=A0ABN3JL82_9ACTN